jgi:CHAD domain-containing protein
MHHAELATLLHRALSTRIEGLMEALGQEGWAEQDEALKRVRVASRRARAVLDMVEPRLYPGFKRQARKLKALTGALGRPRDLDVQVATLAALAPRLPGSAPALEFALEVMENKRRKAKEAMARELEDLSLKHLPKILEVPSLPDPFAPGDLPLEAWAALEPWLERVLPALPGLLDQEDAPALHSLRIQVKRLRYALEILAPAFAGDAAAALRQLKALQTALGNHHDLATLEARLERLRQGLALRERTSLAAGTLAVLQALGEDRACAFEQFRALALATPLDFSASLRRDLRLPPPAEGNPA